MRRRSRLEIAWIALPGWVRIAAVLVVAIPAMFLCAGCARFTDPHYSAEVLVQDEAGCAANPRALPGCVIGFVIFGKWRF